jgi:hypothetical protein
MDDREFYRAKLWDELSKPRRPTLTEIDALAERQNPRDQKALWEALGAATILSWEKLPAEVRAEIVRRTALLANIT